jgi:hypothetical protein
MKHNYLILAAMMAAAPVFSQKLQLTPELVISGGYYKYQHVSLFKEKNGKEAIEGVVSCTIKKDDLYKKFTTFIAINGCKKVLDNSNRLIFSAKQDVGNESVSTPIAVFQRAQSEISFTTVIDYQDSMYTYTIIDIDVDKRLLKVDTKSIANAPEKDLKSLRITGVDVTGFNIATKGGVNSVNFQRISALVAERNGYVNVVIKERKKVNRVKPRYIEKINEMDRCIAQEISLYALEHNSVMKFIEEMNENILNGTF